LTLFNKNSLNKNSLTAGKNNTDSPFQFSGLMCSDTLKQSTFKAQKIQKTEMQYSTVR